MRRKSLSRYEGADDFEGRFSVAKATPIPDDQQQVVSIGELAIIAIPMEAYRKLSDLAMQQNTTAGHLLAKAIDSLIAIPSKPRVLTEEGKVA